MAIIHSYPCTLLDGQEEKITISTGPVIIDTSGEKILLHISTTTGKYQFIGWRLDDTISLRENALIRAREVIGSTLIMLDQVEPLILMGKIDREWREENILLIHYLASITDETQIGDAAWFTMEEIMLLDAENKTSSENIRIASEYFLRKIHHNE